MATRYQRGIEKRKSLKARQCNGHKIPKGYSETAKDQTMQWPKRKKRTNNELKCSRWINSSCSTSGNRRVALFTSSLTLMKTERTGFWIRQKEHIRISIFRNGQQINLTTRNPWFNSLLVSSNPLYYKEILIVTTGSGISD
jgi:hypothetical protein